MESSEALGRIYRKAAGKGSTEAASEGGEADYHYVAFSKLDDGSLIELDGDLGGPVFTPVKLGPEEDLLSGAGVQFVQHFIESKVDAGQSFSLLTLAQI
jgi:Ubiquitin carboxyl-terminal hydrolase, family 1